MTEDSGMEIPNEAVEATVEAWGLARGGSIWLVGSEAAAREAADDDMTVVCKVGGEWTNAGYERGSL